MSQMIGVRQFHNDFRNITKQVVSGEDFIVVRYSTPLFRIVPMEKKKSPAKKNQLSDLKKFSIKTGDPKLSQKIDSIVYDGK